MIWYIFGLSSIIIFAFTIIAVVVMHQKKSKMKRQVNSLHLLFACCFIMAVLLCIPPYYSMYKCDDIGIAKMIVFSVQKAIRVFGADEMYDVVLDNIEYIPDHLSDIYVMVTLGVQFLAPLLTFSFIISFLRNLLPYHRFRMLFWKEAHIFSELNVKTIALANSIRDNNCHHNRFQRWFYKPLIVFTGVGKEDEEANNELLADARRMDAIVFKTDLETIHFYNKLWKREMNFYLISEVESDKIRHATAIIKSYDYSEVSMYVFSDGVECELLMSAWDNKNMKVYRINDEQALIYHNLSLHGIRLFKNAWDNNRKTISAVIVGLGKYGIEMLKALIWYGQVPGFQLKINVYDADPMAEKKFIAQCPEIMRLNRNTIAGEAHYDITIHGGVDVKCSEFYEEIQKNYDATYIFVSLGSDEENISAAVALRTVYEQINHEYKPDIETVVYDTNISKEMSVVWHNGITDDSVVGIKNFKQQAYNIHMIGDLDSFYSVDTVIDSKLVDRGMEVNLRWAKLSDPNNTQEDEQKFWRYDYNYKSSIAKAIHEDLRKQLIALHYIDDIPGIDKDWDKRTDTEKLAIGRFEHVRWNAYMRSEGYVFSGSKEKASRNDLAKQHNNLVPVSELSDDDLRKDA